MFDGAVLASRRFDETLFCFCCAVLLWLWMVGLVLFGGVLFCSGDRGARMFFTHTLNCPYCTNNQVILHETTIE